MKTYYERNEVLEFLKDGNYSLYEELKSFGVTYADVSMNKSFDYNNIPFHTYIYYKTTYDEKKEVNALTRVVIYNDDDNDFYGTFIETKSTNRDKVYVCDQNNTDDIQFDTFEDAFNYILLIA